MRDELHLAGDTGLEVMELPPLDRADGLDALQRGLRRSETSKTAHRVGKPLQRGVVRFDDVVLAAPGHVLDHLVRDSTHR